MSGKLRFCDLVFTRGTGKLARLIWWATREDGESPTQVNHVGIIVDSAPLRLANMIEAVETVRHGSLWNKYHGSGDSVAIFRPTNLTWEQRNTITKYVASKVGSHYGWPKLLLHLGKKLTGWDGFLKLAKVDRYPICSYLVARAFQEAGLDFGVSARAANPDDMWDFCVANPDKYKLLRPLEPL